MFESVMIGLLSLTLMLIGRRIWGDKGFFAGVFVMVSMFLAKLIFR